jgi:hypothetical protein
MSECVKWYSQGSERNSTTQSNSRNCWLRGALPRQVVGDRRSESEPSNSEQVSNGQSLDSGGNRTNCCPECNWALFIRREKWEDISISLRAAQLYIWLSCHSVSQKSAGDYIVEFRRAPKAPVEQQQTNNQVLCNYYRFDIPSMIEAWSRTRWYVLSHHGRSDGLYRCVSSFLFILCHSIRPFVARSLFSNIWSDFQNTWTVWAVPSHSCINSISFEFMCFVIQTTFALN